MTSTDPDWDHFRSFLAVIREGSLSAAARALGLTQPTVGRHIDALEAIAGAPLFLRTQQGLLPTETALGMQPYAEAMAASAAALKRNTLARWDAPEGSVRISASEVVGIEILPPILAGLQAHYPKLDIELSVSDDVEDLLRQEADIAVRMVAPSQGALLSRRIGRIELGFFARKDYLDRHGMPVTLADLAAHRLIGFDRQLAYVRAMLKGVPEMADIRFDFRSDSNLAQLAMIRAGGGIGMCQVGLGRREKDLSHLLQGQLPMGFDTYVVMHESLKAAPRCRVTFDALVEGLGRYIDDQAESPPAPGK